MPAPQPEISVAAVVFVGSFNPTIFQPAWLASQELIRMDEAEVATINLIHDEIVSFSLDWVELEVSRDRCAFATTPAAESPDLMRDLALGTFTVLRHTPIRAVGMNSESHYATSGEERWHELGHKLAPDSLWQGVLEKPGMRTLTMEGVRPDEEKGYIRATVEPSVRVQHGMFFSINDHYQHPEGEDATGADWALQVVSERWEASRERADAIAHHVLST